ncbi:MAG: hypothetical protein J6N81_03940 [Treponema sp.]|nr:hypothetical protein [Treponema sp.]
MPLLSDRERADKIITDIRNGVVSDSNMLNLTLGKSNILLKKADGNDDRICDAILFIGKTVYFIEIKSWDVTKIL